jgi:hypothetical protein
VVGNATHQLRTLKQTGPVPVYAAEFRRLAGKLEWGNQALVGQFFAGLKNSIQDDLVKMDHSKELDILIGQAIRVDNLQKSRAAQLAYYKPALPTASPGQRLTEQQKEHRRQNNLCLYCGAAGHVIRNCPARPKSPVRPARASEATLVAAEPMGNDPAQSW